jgi:hypothetical protein
MVAHVLLSLSAVAAISDKIDQTTYSNNKKETEAAGRQMYAI